MFSLHLQKHRYHLPSHDAVAQILPDHRDLVSGAKSELQNATHWDQKRPAKRAESTPANKPNINQTYHVHHPHKR